MSNPITKGLGQESFLTTLGLGEGQNIYVEAIPFTEIWGEPSVGMEITPEAIPFTEVWGQPTIGMHITPEAIPFTEVWGEPSVRQSWNKIESTRSMYSLSVAPGDEPSVPSDWIFYTGDSDWYFTTENPLTTLTPSSDTFRGGKALILSSTENVQSIADEISFQRQDLPAEWTFIGINGGTYVATKDGLVLTSATVAPASTLTSRNPVSGGLGFDALCITKGLGRALRDDTPAEAIVESPTQYGSFYAKFVLTGVNLDKPDSGTVTPLQVEFYMDAGNFLRASIESNVNKGLSIRVIRAKEYNERTLIYKRYTPKKSEDTNFVSPLFELTRHQGFYSLSLDGTVLVSGAELNADLTGSLRVSAKQTVDAYKPETVIAKIEIGSSVLIAGRLIENRELLGSRRLGFTVPAATQKEVGLVAFDFFGPWGSVHSDEGFEYTLPTGKYIGREKGSVAITYSDKALRDKKSR